MGQGISDFFSYFMKYENFTLVSGLKFRLWDGICEVLGVKFDLPECHSAAENEAGEEGGCVRGDRDFHISDMVKFHFF